MNHRPSRSSKRWHAAFLSLLTTFHNYDISWAMMSFWSIRMIPDPLRIKSKSAREPSPAMLEKRSTKAAAFSWTNIAAKYRRFLHEIVNS